jgi:hypothetical protein
LVKGADDVVGKPRGIQGPGHDMREPPWNHSGAFSFI